MTKMMMLIIEAVKVIQVAQKNLQKRSNNKRILRKQRALRQQRP